MSNNRPHSKGAFFKPVDQSADHKENSSEKDEQDTTAIYKDLTKKLLAQLQVDLKQQGYSQNQINSIIATHWKNMKKDFSKTFIETANEFINARDTVPSASKDKRSNSNK